MRHRLLDEKESVLQSLLSVQNISKHFGNIHALRNVSLDISPKNYRSGRREWRGQIDACPNYLRAIPCDSGEMKYQGRPYKPHDVSDAESLGISVFHQEIPICPHLSIAANVFLGPTIPSLRIRPDWKFMNNRCIELYKNSWTKISIRPFQLENVLLPSSNWLFWSEYCLEMQSL